MEDKVKEIVEIKQRSFAEENQKVLEVLTERYVLFTEFGLDEVTLVFWKGLFCVCWDHIECILFSCITWLMIFPLYTESKCCRINYDKLKTVFSICRNYMSLLKANCLRFVHNQVGSCPEFSSLWASLLCVCNKALWFEHYAHFSMSLFTRHLMFS